MYKVCRAFPLCRHGRFSTKSSGNKDKSGSPKWQRKLDCKQAKCTNIRYTMPRGPLPWEGNKRHCVEICDPPKPDPKCEFCEKVRRLRYSWDVHEEDPCQPYVQPTVLEKTICEIRRWHRCMRDTGNAAKCENLPPLGRAYKVYPMQDVVQKQRIPGCVKPLPPYKRPEPKSDEAKLEPHPKPHKNYEVRPDVDKGTPQKPGWEPKPSVHTKDCPGKETPITPGIVGDNQNILATDKATDK